MRSRPAAKGRKLSLLVAVCLLPALLLSPTAEASRGLPSAALNLEPPVPRLDAEAPAAPRLDLFHIEDELLLEVLTGVEPEHHQALLEHRRLELLPDSAIQKTASGVSTSDLRLNVQKGKPLKPDLRWTVPFYAKARFYDPEVGRFLTEDPAEPDLTTPPSLHKYLYAYGNPTVYWDPDGRETIDVTGDGEVYWVVEKNLPGPINPNTRRVLVGHVAMEKGLFGNKPAGEVQLLEDFGGGFRVPLSSLEKNASLFWGRDDAGDSVFNPSDISDMSPSIQNRIIAGWIDGELNPRRESRLSAGTTYMERSREQMLGGGSADEATLLGVSGQLALGIVGADLPMDLRILKDDFQHMERSPEHLMKIIGDVVALAPVIGAFKYSDEAAVAIKNSDVSVQEARRLLDDAFGNASPTTTPRVQVEQGRDALGRFLPKSGEELPPGGARAARVRGKLEGRFGLESVQNEQYLRLSTGEIAVDSLTGEARRLDFVITSGLEARYSVEVTSKTASKLAQLAKERRIRQLGGTFVRDRTTGELIDFAHVPNRLIRVR